MGNNFTDFSLVNYTDAIINGTLQSLPDLDNPCTRIWNRYFSNDTAHRTWFTGKHSVDKAQMINDCNDLVESWQKGVKQIRWV